MNSYTYPSLTLGRLRVLWLGRRLRLRIEAQREPSSPSEGVQFIFFNALFVEWRSRAARSKLAA